MCVCVCVCVCVCLCVCVCVCVGIVYNTYTCNVYNHAVSSSGYSKRAWPSVRYYPRICLQTQKTSLDGRCCSPDSVESLLEYKSERLVLEPNFPVVNTVSDTSVEISPLYIKLILPILKEQRFYMAFLIRGRTLNV